MAVKKKAKKKAPAKAKAKKKAPAKKKAKRPAKAKAVEEQVAVEAAVQVEAPKKKGKLRALVVVAIMLSVLGGLVFQTAYMHKKKAAMTFDMVRQGGMIPKGYEDGQGMGAVTLAGDGEDNLYFLEGWGGDQPRLQKFSPTNVFIGKYEPKTAEQTIPSPVDISILENGEAYILLTSGEVKVIDKNLNFVRSFSTGLPDVSAIGADSKNRVFVAARSGNKVVYFDRKGRRLGEFGAPGTKTGDLSQPTSMVVTADDRIVIVEATATGPRVKVFSPGLKEIKKFAVTGFPWNHATRMGVNKQGFLFFNDHSGDKGVAVYDINKGEYVGNTKGTTDNALFISPGALGANRWSGSMFLGTIPGTYRSVMKP